MKDEDKINLKYLPKYGITEDVLQSMIKHDIMFPIDKRTRSGKSDYFVKRSDVFMFVNTMLKNQMACYEMLEEVEKKKEEVSKLLSDSETI